MDEKVELEVLGITYNQIRNGVYAMILKEIGGNRRIPVVLAVSDAQAIAVKLEGSVLRRPLAHDLMTSALDAFGISLDEVLIYEFKDGIFHCSLKLSDAEREVVVDSRAGDAVALALRSGAPVYATRALLDRVGVEYPEEGTGVAEPKKKQSLDDLDVSQLSDLLNNAVCKEKYELAAKIQKVINAKNEKASSDGIG